MAARRRERVGGGLCLAGATVMAKFCPVCSATYPDEAIECEDDGSRLVILSEEENLVGKTLDGRYKIKDLIGEGGMGKVYLAHQSTMDREVAVKVLHSWYSRDKEAIQRFMREVRAASKLRHPHTIQVHDFGQTPEGLLYMVLELLEGEALSDMIDQGGPVPWRTAVDITMQVCESLAEAHANAIVHRDLKPDNIHIEHLIGNPNYVKVLDFGVAKMESSIKATQTGAIVGTPAYMSPEQAVGGDDVDGRSDIYALGTILYEMLAGEPAFTGATPLDVLVKHINEQPPPLPPGVAEEVPPAVVEVMLEMLAKQAKLRPESCLVLKERLAATLVEPRPAPEPEPVHERRPTPNASQTLDLGSGFADLRRTPRPTGQTRKLATPRPPVSPATPVADPTPPASQRPVTVMGRRLNVDGERQPTPPPAARSTPGARQIQTTQRPTPATLAANANSAAAQSRSQRPSGVRIQATSPQTRQSTPGGEAAGRPRRSTGSVMRAANISLRRAGTGERIDLLASGPERGVLQFKEAGPSAAGTRLVLVSEDPSFRTTQVTARVTGSEDGLDPRSYCAVEWLSLGAGGYKQLAAAVQRILAVELPPLDGPDHQLEDGMLLVFDVTSGTITVDRAVPVEYQRRQSSTQNRLQAAQPPRRRRVIEISSKRGGRPTKPPRG